MDDVEAEMKPAFSKMARALCNLGCLSSEETDAGPRFRLTVLGEAEAKRQQP